MAPNQPACDSSCDLGSTNGNPRSDPQSRGSAGCTHRRAALVGAPSFEAPRAVANNSRFNFVGQHLQALQQQLVRHFSPLTDFVSSMRWRRIGGTYRWASKSFLIPDLVVRSTRSGRHIRVPVSEECLLPATIFADEYFSLFS